jgi:membrane protease YdiL (CAAX protease family)
MVTELRSEENEGELLKAAPFLPSNYKEFAQFSFLAFSAGICEEIVYRGFLVNYLYGHFIDPVWAYNVAVIFPAIIFGIVHMYQGFKAVLKIAVMSLLFGTIFIFSESLLIVIILHVAVDLLGGFIGMKINQKALSQSPRQSKEDQWGN